MVLQRKKHNDSVVAARGFDYVAVRVGKKSRREEAVEV